MARHTFQDGVGLQYLSFNLLLGELAADLRQVLEDQLSALSFTCPGFPAGEGDEEHSKLVLCRVFRVYFSSLERNNARRVEMISQGSTPSQVTPRTVKIVPHSFH